MHDGKCVAAKANTCTLVGRELNPPVIYLLLSGYFLICLIEEQVF